MKGLCRLFFILGFGAILVGCSLETVQWTVYFNNVGVYSTDSIDVTAPLGFVSVVQGTIPPGAVNYQMKITLSASSAAYGVEVKFQVHGSNPVNVIGSCDVTHDGQTCSVP